MESQAIKVNDVEYLLTFQQNEYAKISVFEDNAHHNIGTLCVNSDSSSEEVRNAILDMQKEQQMNEEYLGQEYLDAQAEYNGETL